MKQVSKLVIVDHEDNYLMMWRSEHPTFPNDPDLPGGTVEEGESSLEAMLREVYEEAGISVDEALVKSVYDGTKYSAHGTHYALYVAKLKNRPDVTISWEHSSYEWLSRDNFLEKAKRAKDTFMQMAYDVLKGGKFDH